jgi:hypothetical protein
MTTGGGGVRHVEVEQHDVGVLGERRVELREVLEGLDLVEAGPGQEPTQDREVRGGVVHHEDPRSFHVGGGRDRACDSVCQGLPSPWRDGYRSVPS